jgi:hypothetical protein
MNHTQEIWMAMYAGMPYPRAGTLDAPARTMDQVIEGWKDTLSRETRPDWRAWLERRIADLEAQRD